MAGTAAGGTGPATGDLTAYPRSFPGRDFPLVLRRSAHSVVVGRSRTSVHSLVWRQIRISTVVISLLLLFVIRVGESAFYSSGGVQGMGSFVFLLTHPAISAL